MTTVTDLLATHPLDGDRALVAACVEACLDCSTACTVCADACLAEDSVARLRSCIRLDQDRADLCAATARIITRSGARSETARAALIACASACDDCADECARHAGMHEHCAACADACRRCARACRDLLAAPGIPM